MNRLLLAFAIVSLAACSSAPTAPATERVPPALTGTIPPNGAATLGDYAVTFTADSACTDLPALARSRTYGVALGPGIATLTGATFGATPSAPYDWGTLYVQPQKDDVKVWFEDPPIWELLSEGRYVVIYGDASGSVSSQTNDWTFSGEFTYCAHAEADGYPTCAVPEVKCRSANHRVTLTLAGR